VALLFALKYPESVLKLILNGANRTPLGMKIHVLVPIWISYACCALLSPLVKNCRRKRELLALMACEPHIRKKALARIEADTLVIAGEKDMIRRRHTESIASSLKNGRLCIIGGDHFIALKNHRAFNEEVWRFLSHPPGNGSKRPAHTYGLRPGASGLAGRVGRSPTDNIL
jgi:pimeloyl-ACP methyl ester carboxylesterase